MSDVIIANLVTGAAAAAVLVFGLAAWLVLVLRQLDRGWRRLQLHRAELDAALKARGDLLPRLVEITRYRLAGERDTLESLSHLRSKSIAGRTPMEKARAEAELDRAVGRVLDAAATDPGLSGLSEFEALRAAFGTAARAITVAAEAYNDAARQYNRRAAGFPGGFLAGLSGTRAAGLFGHAPSSGSAPGGSGMPGGGDRVADSA